MDPIKNTAAAKKVDTPVPLKKKILSAATWGTLSGFWVELPILTAFLFKPFKPKTTEEWYKVNELGVKIVIPATLVGVVYGWIKAGQKKSDEVSTPAQKSWAKAEQERAERAADAGLEL